MKTNLKVFFRKNITAIILLFLLPHIVNILTCTMMNEKQLTDIPSAMLLEDNSSLTRQIAQDFDYSDTFSVEYYPENIQQMERLMQEGKIYFGLVIPDGFTKDLKKFKSPTITALFDGSQLSSASFTKIASSEILMTLKTGAIINTYKGKYNMSSTEALNTAMPISITTRLLGNPTRNYINFLLPGMMLALVQVGMAMSICADDISIKKNITHINVLTNILPKLGTYSIFGYISMISILSVQHFVFQVPFKASFFKVSVLILTFSTAVTCVCFLISVLIENNILSVQAAAVWFIPSSILSGYTWPSIAMPSFISNLASLMPFTYFANTLRDLLLKGHSYFYLRNLIYLMLISLISLIIALILYLLRKYLMIRRHHYVTVDQ